MPKYYHDIAAIPGLFKPLVGETVPDAVVQPETEAEVVALVRWAAERRIPLVPRGRATSGYGGVVPTRRGLVVDFYRMKKIVAVDAAREEVTVEPAITWEKLDAALAADGLTLRLYPTSYPSSSVGGGMFALMKPMFPVLFPRLLPGMMPRVMDNLMPHMLPDVVPLVVPKMIAYLRGQKAAAAA